ncbi:L-aspartate oxidase [Pseudenhygromyxa sp. WMMC2535]|uniref:L-aspartate oxidase n=1 Tax=Pseudenhygromyxa sp. WMMC2535 TaxID=2712867 RepID=UPI0015524EB2|nr:L-aspartate oxidase [Pseudenhygromyxa sp. WMMC2535]
MPHPPVHRTQTLVLGSGLAGLYFALQVADRRTVTILTKHRRESSNTRWAQGGISAVFDPDDTLDAHVADTLRVGAGLCREDMVRRAVELGPKLVAGLAQDFGVQFDRVGNADDAPFELGREGGHSSRRVVHHRDMTGAEIERALVEAVERHPNITILEHHDVIDLLSWAKVDGSEGCFGCYALDIEADQVRAFVAPVTVLATGGAGKVYRFTSNPHVATGDGIAMAYRIGAQVGNLEFMQFHPTILFHPDAKSFLISEALRGEGGILRTADGSDLMKDRHPMGSLAPRDVVAREIDAQLKRSGHACVGLDMTHLDHDFIVDRFPAIHARCMALGIDMRRTPIPVVPAAHYTCGGVVVDPWGRSTVPGLVAIGEVAMSGMHGACRLASNSLLEAVVLARGAAEICDEFGREPPADAKIEAWNEGDAVDSDEAVMVSANWEEVRALMWNYVGIVRSDKRLARARRRLEILHQEIREYYWHYRVTRDVLELRSLALVGYLMVESASRRQESRGLHFTLDYPETDPAQASETIFTRQDGP